MVLLAPSCAHVEPEQVNPGNLALGAAVTSSGFLPEQPVSMVNDGIRDVSGGNFWGSGDFPTQWVEFDLGASSAIVAIDLLVSQSPEGPTVHLILGRASEDEEWRTLDLLDSETSDRQTLRLEPDAPWTGIRYLRIETTESPSWVSWGEVEIWGSAVGQPPLPVVQATETEMLPADGPDLILFGGPILTVDSTFTIAEALAIRGNRIQAVGNSDEIMGMRGTNTVIVDLHGAAVMPGIIDPHIHLIQRQIPDLELMLEDQRILIESGRTTVGIPGIRPNAFASFAGFEDDTIVRVHLYVGFNTNCGEPLPTGFWQSFEFSHDPDQRLSVAGVKVFVDGGSCNGPAVDWIYPDPLPPDIGFTDWYGNGSLYITAEELAGVVRETGDRGGQVVVHVAGERAIVTGLDGMELALDGESNPQRHRLDHNDLVPIEHRTRYGQLGVIPVVFGDYDSCFAPAGMWSLLAPPEALQHLQHTHDLIVANPGLPIAWHSDLPFTRIDIFAQMQFLVNLAEVSEDGSYCNAPDFLADQGVGIEQAMRMMTWNAAYAMNLEDHIGSLETGKRADLIIMRASPLELTSTEVYRNVLWATVIDGVTQYCAGPEDMCDPLGR